MLSPGWGWGLGTWPPLPIKCLGMRRDTGWSWTGPGLPSRQILTYSLRDERHSGLGWGGGGSKGGRQQIFTTDNDTSQSAEPRQSVMLLYYPCPGSRLLSRILWSNTSIPLNVGDTDQGCCITLLVLDEVSSQAGDGEINKKKQPNKHII